MELLLNKIRAVTDSDRKALPTFSYSKMDVFKTCALQYHKKYNEKKYTKDTSIALELGGLCHYILEQKGKMLASLSKVDYNKLEEITKSGNAEKDEKTKDMLLGVEKLRKKYFDIWYEPDNASGKTYEEKMTVFDQVLHTEMEDDEWEPIAFEQHFEFVWDNKVIIQGFIDRIDCKDGEYRTVDYKTSKKIYDQSKLATSLQFGIYALAILLNYGKLPKESMYRFILINEKQYALTKGWEKRLIKAMDKIFDEIESNEKTGIWKPKPSPLCHWCFACTHNPDAHEFKDDCEYYSLWTPENKSFAVNKEFNETEQNSAKLQNNTRKLIF